MTPKLAQALDPIFLRVIDLLERVDRGERISASSEQGILCDLIDGAGELVMSEPQPWDTETWNDAKYGLVSWIDEMLVDLSSGTLHEWWKNNVLERELFDSRECREKFFLTCKDKLIRGRTTSASGDAIEVYYVCTLLGFRGLYRDPETAPQFTMKHRLPETREEWANGLWSRVKQAQARVQADSDKGADVQAGPDRDLITARPHQPIGRIIWPWLLFAVAAGINVICLYHL